MQVMSQAREIGILSGNVSVKFELVRFVSGDRVSDWHARGVQFSDSHLSHGLKFTKEKPVEDTIRKSILEFMLSYLPVNTQKDNLTAREAEYCDTSVRLSSVFVSIFDPVHSIQRCIFKFHKAFGDLNSIFKNSNLFSHFEFIAEYLPTKIAQEVVIPLFRLSQISEEAFVYQSDELLAERTIQNLRNERERIASYLEYYDRYLEGDSPLLEKVSDARSLSISQGNTTDQERHLPPLRSKDAK